ncbi:MAG: spore coat protein GerQ [Clostridium sp.]|nr:spore coat protein GerQ [Clostridium sp.]MCM1444542.1 spore coat protein GerQ [Candidatus Amulumruptor caecigallinarius]
MNNNTYNSVFPGTPLYTGNNIPTPNQSSINYSTLPLEQSYIENILRLNKGKKVTVHMTFPDSNEFRDREFVGVIEQSGRDHIIISDPISGVWYLLLMIYVDFITFEESINYSEEFIPGN